MSRATPSFDPAHSSAVRNELGRSSLSPLRMMRMKTAPTPIMSTRSRRAYTRCLTRSSRARKEKRPHPDGRGPLRSRLLATLTHRRRSIREGDILAGLEQFPRIEQPRTTGSASPPLLSTRFGDSRRAPPHCRRGSTHRTGSGRASEDRSETSRCPHIPGGVRCHRAGRSASDDRKLLSRLRTGSHFPRAVGQ